MRLRWLPKVSSFSLCLYLKIVEVRQCHVQEEGDGQEEEAEGATDGANGSEVAMESFQIKGELAPTNLK